MTMLLREALRSPRDIALILGSLLLAMLVTSPLPTYLWGPTALILAAIPGTAIMNRVRRRAEDRLRQEQDPPDQP
ncbi:MAG TPA: hypothetical protein VJ735_06755 [Actinomycetes bacterium]|nr:hypothetical protein [Actinomycetes bacterium]